MRSQLVKLVMQANTRHPSLQIYPHPIGVVTGTGFIFTIRLFEKSSIICFYLLIFTLSQWNLKKIEYISYLQSEI